MSVRVSAMPLRGRQTAGPVYRSIVAVDIEGSTTRSNSVKGELRRALYDMLGRAFEAAITEPLEQVVDRWESRRASADQQFKDLLEASSLGTPAARQIRASTPASAVEEVLRRQAQRSHPSAPPPLGKYLEPFTDRGDGVLVLVRPHDDVPKTVLIDRVIPQLTALLAEYNTAAAEPEGRMRLRAVVHAGEVYDDGWGFYGEALDVAFRLLDCASVKRKLRQTTSPLILVVSQEIYSAMVSAGYDGAGTYQSQVRVRAAGRQYRGWVHVPDAADIASAKAIPDARTRRSSSSAIPSGPADGTVQDRQRARNAVIGAGLSRLGRQWNTAGSVPCPAVEVELCS